MNSKLALALAMSLALIGCGKKQEAKAAKPGLETTKPGNPITAPVDYLGAVGKAKKSAERAVDLNSLNQAIRLFQASEERFPSSLNELVTEGYLPRLPTPPAGMKLHYDSSRGQARMVRQ